MVREKGDLLWGLSRHKGPRALLASIVAEKVWDPGPRTEVSCVISRPCHLVLKTAL